ncbi:hypothetical protein [Streptodolium elevatio]|uniref:Uncharacterized protein n=1 Tax=Streptodolium elevatio TaxID=3157996 RepID=A0ABV3DMG4_9ACTN
MTTHDIDQLRQTLAERAEEAPPELGMLATVMAAAPARRRRTVFQATGAAMAVVAAAVTVPLLLDGGDAPTQQGSAGPAPSTQPTVPPAAPIALPASVTPGKPFAVIEESVIGTTQYLEIRGTSVEFGGGAVAVYAAGSFDPEPYKGGEAVTVNGMPGYFNKRYPLPPVTSPLSTTPPETYFATRLVWQTPDDRWLVYTTLDEQSRETTLLGAEALSLTDPRQVRVPMGLPQPADGVRLEAVRTGNSLVALTFATGGLPTPPPDAQVGDTEDGTRTGFVLIMQPRPGMEHAIPQGVVPVRLGEADTWYTENPEESVVSFDPNQSGTLIATDKCVGSIRVKDKQEIPKAEIEAFIAGIDFGDCTDPSTWVALQR